MEHHTFRRRVLALVAIAWLGPAFPALATPGAGLATQSEGPAGHDAQGEETAPTAPPPAVAAEKSKDETVDSPGPEIEAFLGTWVHTETLERDEWRDTRQVERYLLLKWRKGKLRVKTFDYYPDLRTRGMESDWNGSIIVDRWNVENQTFTPMADGTISVGMSGTNGVGPAAASSLWWAAGRLTVEESEDGPVLRLVTTQGNAPSSKGNIWQPLDRTYRLVSREIDPRYEARRHR